MKNRIKILMIVLLASSLQMHGMHKIINTAAQLKTSMLQKGFNTPLRSHVSSMTQQVTKMKLATLLSATALAAQADPKAEQANMEQQVEQPKEQHNFGRMLTVDDIRSQLKKAYGDIYPKHPIQNFTPEEEAYINAVHAHIFKEKLMKGTPFGKKLYATQLKKVTDITHNMWKNRPRTLDNKRDEYDYILNQLYWQELTRKHKRDVRVQGEFTYTCYDQQCADQLKKFAQLNTEFTKCMQDASQDGREKKLTWGQTIKKHVFLTPPYPMPKKCYKVFKQLYSLPAAMEYSYPYVVEARRNAVMNQHYTNFRNMELPCKETQITVDVQETADKSACAQATIKLDTTVTLDAINKSKNLPPVVDLALPKPKPAATTKLQKVKRFFSFPFRVAVSGLKMCKNNAEKLRFPDYYMRSKYFNNPKVTQKFEAVSTEPIEDDQEKAKN